MEGNSALVVGEDEEARVALSRHLDSAGFSTMTASNGTQALDILAKIGVTLVMCDWSMKSMCGQEFCRRLRSISVDHYVYFIFFANNSENVTQQALEAGADDYVANPVQSGELDGCLRSATRIIELQQKMAARNDFLEYAYASVTTDLKIAAKVQEDLLPRQFRLAGLYTNWVFKPANFVAGDMFDYFPLGNDYFVFYILDVEGHGIASALTSFAINNQLNPSSHGLCAKTIKHNPKLNDAVTGTLDNLNRQFQGNLNSSRYFTMIYGIVEVSTGNVTLAQAGHPPPVVLNKNTGKADLLGNGGMPVGLLKEATYESVNCTLKAGDRLYVYSDGMIECENNSGEFYGTERLTQRIQEWRDIPIDKLGDLFDGEITRWNGSDTFEDDVSMVILEYTGKR